MGNAEEADSIWPVTAFLAAVSVSFIYGEVWMGVLVTIIGIIALGWKKRHEGPLPTNKPKR